MSIQERELPKTLNSLMKHLRDGGIAIPFTGRIG